MKFIDVYDLQALCQVDHRFSTEKMYGKAINFINTLSPVNAGAIMRIISIPDCINLITTRFQNTPYFIRQAQQFGHGQCHTIKHMGIAGIEKEILKR